MSAVRSAASSARRRAAREQHLGRAPSSRHCPSTTRLSTSSTPHWRIASATAARPKTTPGCFCTIRARAAGVLGHGRLGGDVARADVLGQRPGDQLLDVRRQLGHRGSLASRSRCPMSGQSISDLTFGPPARLIPQSDRAAPVPDPARRARRRRAGDPARRGRPRRRRGLLPGDVPGGAARLPEARATPATCAAGC